MSRLFALSLAPICTNTSANELGATFITALNTCPVCDERLDIAPAFPSSVALYLKRTRSANKVNVTFDYETESFVPVEDGEFVVVTNAIRRSCCRERRASPRAAIFTSTTRTTITVRILMRVKCTSCNPRRLRDCECGWKLETTGVLEVVLDQPKPKIVSPAREWCQKRRRRTPPKAAPRPARKSARKRAAPETPEPRSGPRIRGEEETPKLRAANAARSLKAVMRSVGSVVTHSRRNRKPSRNSNDPPRGTLLASAMVLDDDELTVQHEMRPANSSVFPWTAAKQPEHPSSSRGSVLKLMAIGGVAFLLVSLGLFGLTRSDNAEVASQVASTTQRSSNKSWKTNRQRRKPRNPRFRRKSSTKRPTEPSPSVSAEDELLARMRERRITATNSERPKIFEAFAKIERKYPRDYRFPYERAKLAAKGSKSGSRNEAFKALSVAAERAISTGKASEMLSGLETDKAGDFHRLAQGRQEWTRLVAALKRKDTSLLQRAKTQYSISSA